MMLAIRKAKIRSHRKALLEAQRAEDSEGELSDHAYRSSMDDHGHLGMALTGVPLRMQVTQGVIARLEPYHLPLLLFYTLCLLFVSESPHLPSAAKLFGSAGSAVVNALSMVSGLLLSYESSSALSKWEQGRRVWVNVRTEIRASVRMISLLHLSDNPLSPTWIDVSASPRSEFESVAKTSELRAREQLVHQRAEEMSALLVAFAFALQYHLNKTRAPLSQPPFSDLLPPSYYSTLKRTDSSVRFAEKHMDGINTSFSNAGVYKGVNKPRTPSPTSEGRPVSPGQRGRVSGVKRGRKRSTSGGGRVGKVGGESGEGLEMDKLAGVTTKEDEVESSALDTMDDADLSLMSGDNAEELEIVRASSRPEKQIQHLNTPSDGDLEPLLSGTSTHTNANSTTQLDPALPPAPRSTKPLQASPLISITRPESIERPHRCDSHQNHPRVETKGVLANKYPRNLPLAILRMLEAYVQGLARLREESTVAGEAGGGRSGSSGQVGWTASQAEKGYATVRKLGDLLGEAEMLADAVPPLVHSLHLSHILVIVLMAIPAQLLPMLGRWTIPIALLSGWALIGMQALSKEVGEVFGHEDHNLPTHKYCADILSETLDMSDLFKQGYLRRVEARCRSAENGVAGGKRADRAARLLRERRVEDWLPGFGVSHR